MKLSVRSIILVILIIGAICCFSVICIDLFTKEKTHIHNYDQWVSVRNPDCINEGLRERFCTCGDRQESVVAALGHENISYDAKPADCINGGYKAYVKCTRCDYSTYEETEALGHDFGEWKILKASTCTDFGEEVRECSRDNAHVETRKTDKTEHTPAEWRTESYATCTKYGLEYIECSVCFTRLDMRQTDKTPHNPSDWITDKLPECEVDGERHKECTVCGEKLQTDGIKALEHAFEIFYDENNHYSKCSLCKTEYSGPHIWTADGCECGYVGLVFELDNEKNYYVLSGIKNGILTKIEIPEKYNGKNVAAIAKNTFSGFNGVSITVPSFITHISKGAFWGCGNLRELKLPFMGTDVETPANLGYLFGAEAVEDNAEYIPQSLVTVEILSGVEVLGDEVFKNCATIKNVILPDTVEALGESCFYLCTSLENVKLSANLKKIGLGAFAGCRSLISIEIPASVEEIGSLAFVGIAPEANFSFENKIGWSVYDNGTWKFDISESELSDNNLKQTLNEYMKYTWKCNNRGLF